MSSEEEPLEIYSINLSAEGVNRIGQKMLKEALLLAHAVLRECQDREAGAKEAADKLEPFVRPGPSGPSFLDNCLKK